jgi:chromosome partitioning protein
MLILGGGEKGGTGKTTLMVNLATMRALKGRDVLLYDMDPQRTATLWASRRDENGIQPRVASSQKILDPRVLSPGAVIRNELKALMPKYEDILVDAGGANNEVLRAAMSLADVVIFPITPSDFDMWTFGNLSNLIASAQGKDSDLKGYIFLNRVSTNPGAARQEIIDCDDFLEDFDNLTRLKSVLYQRKPIRKNSGNGLAIIEAKPMDEKASEEIKAIYEEVFNG